MRVPIDEQFQTQRKQFRLAFTCEDCVYLDRARDCCAHGYPDAAHRDSAFECDAKSVGMFCKEFEIV